MSKQNQATKTVVLLAIISFLSKILGFLRESLIASKFGSGSNTDAFFLAITTIAMFSMVVSSSIGTTLIPILSEVEKDEGKQGKERHLNNFLNIISIVAIILAILAVVFAPFLLRVLAAGFDDKSFELVLLLTRIGSPTILFSAIIGVFKGYLESEGMFKESSIAMILSNIVLIIFLTTLASRFDVRALMIVYTIAEGAPLIPQYISLKSKGFKYEAHVDLKDPYMKKVLRMIPPILLSVAINDVNAMADNAMASTLVSGSVSSLQYARRIDGITTGIFIGSIFTVIFPLLSTEANKEDKTGFKKVVTQGTNIILLITIPATVGMIVLATPIIRLTFERNMFTAADTMMAAGALTFLAIGLSANSVKQYIYRAFYSLQDTKTPTINSAATVALNIVLNFIFIGPMKHRGLALGTSLASIISSFFLINSLRKKVGQIGIKSMVVVLLKSFVASLLMGVVAHFSFIYVSSMVSSGTIGLLISLLVSVTLSVIIYFVSLLVLRVEELNVLVGKMRNKLNI